MIRRVLRTVGGAALGLLALALAALPAVFLNTLYGYLPVLLLAFALLLSLAVLAWQRFHVQVQFDGKDAECMRGDTVETRVRIANPTPLSCPRAAAELVISDPYGGVDAALPISFCLAAHSSDPFSFSLSMPHVGVYTVRLAALRLWDSFGLFCCRVPAGGAFEVLVQPRLRELEPLQENLESQTESMHNTRRTVPGGSDYVGVREYALGDPIKQIHWKLSAHSQGYLTKLSETGRQTRFSVLLDLAAPKAGAEECMELNDCLVETAFSALRQAARSDPDCTLLYCDRGGSVQQRRSAGGQVDPDLLRALHPLLPEPPASFPDACRILTEDGRTQSPSTHIIVCTSRVTAELVQQLLEVRRQKRCPILYYVLPARLTRREREERQAVLRPLEDAEILCRLFETAPAAQEGGAT